MFPQVLPTIRGLDGFKRMIVASEGDGARVSARAYGRAEALEANSPTLDRLRDAESGGRNIESQESVAFRVIGFELDR